MSFPSFSTVMEGQEKAYHAGLTEHCAYIMNGRQGESPGVEEICHRVIRVEKECGFVRSEYRTSLPREQSSQSRWVALVAPHRRLMHEHYKLYLESQKATAPPTLFWLLKAWALPTRLWHHAISPVLELLRVSLPGHLHTFLSVSESMLALLLETVPRFQANWNYALEQLTEYRLETELMETRDSIICRDTATSWYQMAVEQAPCNGALYMEFGFLSWPDLVSQLSFFMCGTISHERSHRSYENAAHLLSPVLKSKKDYGLSLAGNAFVTAIALLLTRGHSLPYHKALCTIGLALDAHIHYIDGEKFQTTGAFMALSLCAAVLGFGADDSLLFGSVLGRNCAPVESLSHNLNEAVDLFLSPPQDHMLNSPVKVVAYAGNLFCSMTAVVLSRYHDRNILSFANIILSFLSGTLLSPTAFVFVADFVPWNVLAHFANVLVKREGIAVINFEGGDLRSTTLPEDDFLREVIWDPLLPAEFLHQGKDDKQIGRLSQERVRAQRCLWYIAHIAQVSQRLKFDPFTKRYSNSPFLNLNTQN